MRTNYISFLGLMTLLLVGCAASQRAAEDSPALPPPADITGISSTPTGVAASTDSATAGWLTYTNLQAGYSAKYPADWTVNESVGGNGELVTMFMAPDNAQGLSVNVLNGETIVEESPDMPNTRCRQVTISGASGQRCFDTLAFSLSTTFSGHDKQFAVVSIGKHPDETIYQSFLENFTMNP